MLANDRGAPVLPAGWVGSITHKGARGGAGRAGGARARRRRPRARGAAAPDIAQRILTARERAALTDAAPSRCGSRSRRRSTRRSIRIVRRYVGFTEVELVVRARWRGHGDVVDAAAAGRDRGVVARARRPLARDRARAPALRPGPGPGPASWITASSQSLPHTRILVVVWTRSRMRMRMRSTIRTRTRTRIRPGSRISGAEGAGRRGRARSCARRARRRGSSRRRARARARDSTSATASEQFMPERSLMYFFIFDTTISMSRSTTSARCSAPLDGRRRGRRPPRAVRSAHRRRPAAPTGAAGAAGVGAGADSRASSCSHAVLASAPSPRPPTRRGGAASRRGCPSTTPCRTRGASAARLQVETLHTQCVAPNGDRVPAGAALQPRLGHRTRTYSPAAPRRSTASTTIASGSDPPRCAAGVAAAARFADRTRSRSQLAGRVAVGDRDRDRDRQRAARRIVRCR